MLTLPSDVTAHLRQGRTLIVPTRQQVHAVQLAEAAAQLAHGARVWSTPDVLTPTAWARRACERAAERESGKWPRILGPAEEWFLWREAAQEAAQGLPVLDAELLSESLRRSSERAAAYGLAPGVAHSGSEAELHARARQLFASRCRELHAASVSALLPRLAALAEPGALLLRGFDSIPPTLAALGAVPAGEAHEAALPPRGVWTADAQAQLEAIAAWCCEKLRADPAVRLLVILPGGAGERERLAALIRSALDPGADLAGDGHSRTLVGSEDGKPFSSLPLPSQALLSLALLAGEALDVETICRWLTSPFWAGLPLPARAALALALRERAGASLDLHGVLGALQLAPQERRALARDLDGRLRRAAGLLAVGSGSPRRWAERFETALAALGWPGALAPDSALQQTRLRWRELLEEVGGLASGVGEVPRESALELLRALARRTSFRPTDGDVPVMISPALTDPVVIYDGIWVGSLSAEVLPQPVMPDPFLPLHAQIEAGMPEASAAGRRAQARALLAAWRAAARELVLSVPRRAKDLEVLPSPALAGLAFGEETPRSLWLPQRLHRHGCTERLADDRGTAFNARVPLPGGVRSLTLQSACPFRAYAELRLGASAEERAEPGIPMDQRGTLLHTALQLLWLRLRNSERLSALEEGELQALIEDCVRQATGSLPAHGRDRRRRVRHAEGQFDLFSVRSPALERESRRAERLIRRLCELERTRAPFTVEALEQPAELALGGGRLRLRIDRIDALAEGRAVLDYKSGRALRPDWLSERPAHPQLLAYLAALGRDVVALATVHLTAREVRFSGVAAATGVLPRVKGLPAAADWPAQQLNWESLIERLIRAFLEGDARVDPAAGACDHCHVTDICRISADMSPEAASAVEEADE